jgi:hypothetical protein
MNTGTPTERPTGPAPASEQFGPGLERREAQPVNSRRDVMNTLLGKNNLVACDLSGDDPYNSTGKFFRR